jgi:hypothetical protein
LANFAKAGDRQLSGAWTMGGDGRRQVNIVKAASKSDAVSAIGRKQHLVRVQKGNGTTARLRAA